MVGLVEADGGALAFVKAGSWKNRQSARKRSRGPVGVEEVEEEEEEDVCCVIVEASE